MKKIFALLSVLLMLSTLAWGLDTGFYDFTKTSFQKFVTIYNSTGVKISSNTVVILDPRYASTAVGFAAYASQSSATAANNILGIADEDIATAKVGRICIWGPHLVKVNAYATNLSRATTSKNRYPGTGDFVINAAIGGYAGRVVRASGPQSNGVLGYERESVGRRIGTGTGDASYMATAGNNSLIWIWVSPGSPVRNNN